MIERHPNLNAAGLAVDVTHALVQRVRGDARRLTESELVTLTQTEILRFVERIDIILDMAAPRNNV